MSKPKVSFLSPTYNKESWISETIENLMKQTLEDIEIVFINDGSTDGTYDVIKHYMKQDKRIKCISLKQNVGLGKAWNIGTRLVNSDIICVASGDDLWDIDRAKITWEYFQKHKNKDVFYGSFYFCDSRMKPVEYKEAIPFKKGEQEKILANGHVNQYIGHFVMSYRKRIALKVPYRADYKVGIDHPFLVDLEKAGARFGWTKKILGWARILNSGVSISRRSEVENAKV